MQSNPLFEERNVDIRRQLFVDFLHTGVQLSISLFLGRIFRYQRYNISHLQEILPKLRSLHKPILAILLLNHLPDRRRQLRPGLRVAPRPIGQYLPYTHLPLLNHLRFLYLLVLKLLQVLRKLPLARELRVHLYHTLGKLKPRESTGRVYLHFLKKVPGEKLPNIRNLLLSMVHTQGVQIEVHPMCEIEVSRAALDDEADELLIRQILLDDHEGDDLRDEVLDVVPLVIAVDDRVDPLGREELVDPRRLGGVLVELVEDLVDRLLVVMLDVLEFLGGGRGTIPEERYRLSIGIEFKTG